TRSDRDWSSDVCSSDLGRVEFLRVPTGAWIVRDWVIRMPLARITRTPVAQDPVPIVVGFLEHGGSALEIKTQRGTVVYRADGREIGRASCRERGEMEVW